VRWRLPAVIVVATLTAGACQVAGVGHPPSYEIQADFPNTIGLYPGSFVRQLGINVGSVSQVVDRGDHVLVTMKIDKSTRLAAKAHAVLVADSVLGERYVQFLPAYTGGTPMAADTVIPESDVSVPVETDTVLRSLNTVLRGINPTDVKQFTENLAAILQGNGQTINQLIANAAGTFSLLASKSQDLGQLTTTLAALSSQLGTRDQALAQLITDYDLLSQTIAGDRSQLDGVITSLTSLTTQATGLLAPNLTPIRNDVADLTTVGQTLDRNIDAVDIGLQYSPRLFSAAQRAYDPEHNWLPLNTQSPGGLTSSIFVGDIRDALASICRRLGAQNPALAAVTATCGNPSSSFFNPILGTVPSLINQVPGQGPTTPTTPSGSSAATASSHSASSASDPSSSPSSAPAPAAVAAPTDAADAFAAGLAAIPGLSADQRQALAADDAPSAEPATAPATAPTAAAAATAAPGSEAVAMLASTPRGSSPPSVPGLAELGPPPHLTAAPAHHPGGWWHHLGTWLGSWL
jgi:phospholipid/cholesterol/gamma-HCH transport system substrate-binding protein